jgi:hypothetical protein
LLPFVWLGTFCTVSAFMLGFAGLVQRQGNRTYAAIGFIASVTVLLSLLYWWYWPEWEFWAYCNHDYATEIPGCADQFGIEPPRQEPMRWVGEGPAPSQE